MLFRSHEPYNASLPARTNRIEIEMPPLRMRASDAMRCDSDPQNKHGASENDMPDLRKDGDEMTQMTVGEAIRDCPDLLEDFHLTSESDQLQTDLVTQIENMPFDLLQVTVRLLHEETRGIGKAFACYGLSVVLAACLERARESEESDE